MITFRSSESLIKRLVDINNLICIYNPIMELGLYNYISPSNTDVTCIDAIKIKYEYAIDFARSCYQSAYSNNWLECAAKRTRCTTYTILHFDYDRLCELMLDDIKKNFSNVGWIPTTDKFLNEFENLNKFI